MSTINEQLLAQGKSFYDRTKEVNAKMLEALASYESSPDKPVAALIDALEQAEDVVSSLSMLIGHCSTYQLLIQATRIELEEEARQAGAKLAEAVSAAELAHTAAAVASSAVGKETGEAVDAQTKALEAQAKAAAADILVAELRAKVEVTAPSPAVGDATT